MADATDLKSVTYKVYRFDPGLEDSFFNTVFSLQPGMGKSFQSTVGSLQPGDGKKVFSLQSSVFSRGMPFFISLISLISPISPIKFRKSVLCEPHIPSPEAGRL